MKRNYIILLSILTITLIASTVWYVQAENKSRREQGFTVDWAVTTHSEAEPSPTPTPFFAGLDLFAPVRPTQGSGSSSDNLSNPAPDSLGDQPDVNFTPNLTGLPPQPGATIQPGSPGRTSTNVPTSTQPNSTDPTQSKPAGLTPTSTPPPKPTATPQTLWIGDWAVWFQEPDETFKIGEVKITNNASQLIGVGKIGGVQYEFNVTYYDELSAQGNWTTTYTSGTFMWEFINTNQFGGSRDEYFGFCGAKAETGKPDPCIILPIR